MNNKNAVYLSRIKEDFDSLTNRKTDYICWAQEHDYQTISKNQNELIIAKDDNSSLVFVGRKLFGPLVFTLETRIDHVNLTNSLSHIQMNIENWESLYFRYQWRKQRCLFDSYGKEISICTNQLPNIVVTHLREIFEITDQNILREIAGKLMLFGTKDFGLLPKITPEDFSQPWLWSTKQHICYSTGELQLITSICSLFAKDCNGNTPFDVSILRTELQRTSTNCPIDIRLYGRKTNGSGLRDYKPTRKR